MTTGRVPFITYEIVIAYMKSQGYTDAQLKKMVTRENYQQFITPAMYPQAIQAESARQQIGPRDPYAEWIGSFPQTPTAEVTEEPAPATPVMGLGQPEVMSMGGYDVLVTRDASGNILDIQSLGRTVTPEAFPSDVRIIETPAGRFAVPVDAQGNPAGNMTYIGQEAEEAAGPLSYAAYRQQILGELSQPEDWISRWMAGHAINQQQQRAGIGGAIRRMEQSGQALWEETQAAPQTMPAPPVPSGGPMGGPMGEIGGQMPQGEMANPERLKLEAKLAAARAKYAEALQQQQETEALLAAQPQTAPAPPWLSRFAPSQTAGQPISKQNIRTPSAQQWGATPSSQRAGLGGYMEWTGGRNLADLLSHMQTMLPEQPGGAGRERWAPAIQRR